jgi:hypothetical protein
LAAALALSACSGDDSSSRPADRTMPGGTIVERVQPGEPEHQGPRTRVRSEGGGLVVETTSARADMVSGGQVLLTVIGAGGSGGALEVHRNGDDVTDAFAAIDGETTRGLVDGLAVGDNAIEVRAGGESVGLTVVNHPKNGPVFSGPHLEPWVCKTELYGLGRALDDDCDAPSVVRHRYVTTDGSVRDLDDPSIVPADADTVEVAGEAVPFVIRNERGVIDRGVYSISVLDPVPGADTWDAGAWNQRLVFRFGGGCGTNYAQASSLIPLGDGDTELLRHGYAVATNTLDTFQTACNATLSAEAMMMTREHFVERYGVPEFTIGDGGSGGAIQQLLIAHSYPGLLDALSPSVPFPDAISISGGVTDCGLLLAYYASERGAALTDEQRAAINGHATTGTCQMWSNLFLSAVDPRVGCDAEIPAAEIYDPTANPDGVRCTLQDINVNVLGRDPLTGFARRPLDNVGIQYGLGALRDGVITVDQFLDLNEHIGGYDVDGDIVAKRASATPETMARAHRVGAVIGAGPLQELPILLRNVYTDRQGDIHTRFQAFSIRERLRVGGDDNPNVLLWTLPSGEDLIRSLVGSIGDATEPIRLLDEWLTTGRRPSDATNRCVLPDGEVLRGGWELYDEPGPCADAYPVHADPRLVAGQGLDQSVLKCALVPVDPDVYGVALSAEQRARLERVFPDGVCDWSQPGVGQEPTATTWPRY